MFINHFKYKCKFNALFTFKSKKSVILYDICLINFVSISFSFLIFQIKSFDIFSFTKIYTVKDKISTFVKQRFFSDFVIDIYLILSFNILVIISKP